MKYYSLVQDFPFYPELKEIIYATVGLGDYLRKKFKELRQIELAFIYVSVAKNGETAKSDIDLFVVGEIENTVAIGNREIMLANSIINETPDWSYPIV